MKNICLFLCVLIPVFSWAESDDILLIKVDQLASYMDTDFSAEYTIVQSKPGQNNSSTTAAVFRRDSKEQYVIRIMEPVVSRGQGYLKEGNMLWFYDPESKVFNSTSSRERFQNSNASNSDFTRSTLAQDYWVISGKNETLGKFKCRVLTLKAKNTDLVYPEMRIWISEDNLLRKTEDYSLSGQLLRTTAIPEYYTIGKRYVPKGILIIDALRGATINGKFVHEQTKITIKQPFFEKIADNVFSKTFLETMAHGGKS
ncbi:MAG: outer membrane lipoprotein-sorting protein [Spirochaetaceae bacterium]|jgi:outer membrane lipoprotein-sorting protein|nr:outer membrane lipoprotein-sorting protein [Spirochaetaceae bacterium]